MQRRQSTEQFLTQLLAELFPKTGPIIIPNIIRNKMSGIPVFLKNASPKTPSMITTLAARSKIGADATNESPKERLANVPCKFVIPSRRKFEPN